MCEILFDARATVRREAETGRTIPFAAQKCGSGATGPHQTRKAGSAFSFSPIQMLRPYSQPVDRRVGRSGIYRAAIQYAIRPSPKKEGRLIYRDNPKADAGTQVSPSHRVR